MKGWKNLNKNLTCRRFHFKIGKKEKHAGQISMCEAGFHFHTNPFDLFQFYEQDPADTVVAEIEASGEIKHGARKSVCSEITIIKILTAEEIKFIGNQQNNIGWANTGDWNTGDRNTGGRNTGHRNTGHWNTGHSNTGHSNTGYWNTGGNNTGDRNTGSDNTGDDNTGNDNTGYRNTGDNNTGDNNTGDSNTGDWNIGGRNTGDWNTGHSNTGGSNTGHRNTGDWNTGGRNTGHWNTGHRNTGDRNTGRWNKSNNSTGFFNSKEPETISVFNKPCNKKLWEEAAKPNFIYFDKTWGDNLYKLTKKDICILQKLPNFDDSIFEEISGFSIADLTRYEILFQKFTF